MNSEIDSVSYSLGVNIATNIKKQGFDSLNTAMLAQAIDDVYKSNPLKISADSANQILQAYFEGLQHKVAGKNVEAGKKFLEDNKSKPGVVTLPSGLQYMVIKEGTGEKPTISNTITAHYHGTLIDGKVFDSSVQRGEPASFPVSGVIKGWTEALQLMKVGSKWRLFIPSELAYGERGAGAEIGPNTVLIFDVELLSIDK
jgi:FKBP-type peptidyl-prolyl cis-trans isomerase FklB